MAETYEAGPCLCTKSAQTGSCPANNEDLYERSNDNTVVPECHVSDRGVQFSADIGQL